MDANLAERVLIIRRTRAWSLLEWSELWGYRDLLYFLIRRDFLSKYAQTMLGPLWFILQPLLLTVIFTVIFGGVAKIPTEGAPPFLFYLCGMIPWGYLAQNFTNNATTLVTHLSLFGKVYFPRLLVPVAGVATNLIGVGIQLGTFAVFLAWYLVFPPAGVTLRVGWSALWFPLFILQTAVCSLGVCLLFSALTAKYRDFTHLTTLVIQAWIYATPVIYPLSQVPAKYQWAAMLNPMTVPVEGCRIALLGAGHLTPLHIAVSAAVTAGLLIVGLLVFDRIQRNFVDTV